MIISIEKSIKQTRTNLQTGFSSLETIPRFLYTENILNVIADENHMEHFNVKYKHDNGFINYIKIFGTANEFCQLMHTGGHLKSNL
jgi:hypothetical protein